MEPPLSEADRLPPPSPVRYDPSVETLHPQEAEIGASILDSMRKVREKTFEDYGHAVRSVHAKSHGVLKGKLQSPLTCRRLWPRGSSRGQARIRSS